MYCYISNVKFSEMMNKMKFQDGKYFLAVTSDLIEQKGHNGPILLTRVILTQFKFTSSWQFYCAVEQSEDGYFYSRSHDFYSMHVSSKLNFFWWWQPCEVKSKSNKTFRGDIVKRFFFIFSQRPSCLANWNTLSYFG